MKYLFIAMLLFSNQIKSQTFKLQEYINNNQVRFGVWHISPVVSDTILLVPPKDVIHVKMADSLKERIKNIRNEEWLFLLQQPEMDWTINLILYELFEKEALQFRVIKTKDLWEKTYKKEDIDYWKKKLNSSNN